jgi:hypothetical protein
MLSKVRYCWIEPHYGVPFFPILSDAIQRSLMKLFNLSNHRSVVTKDPDYIKKTRWLSNAEYQNFFPDACIFLSPTLETIVIVKRQI